VYLSIIVENDRFATDWVGYSRQSIRVLASRRSILASTAVTAQLLSELVVPPGCFDHRVNGCFLFFAVYKIPNECQSRSTSDPSSLIT